MKNCNSPLVSIIVPNFNHAKFLPERLNSIFSQTYQNFEVIILDDHSTDNSLDIIEKYKNKERVRCVIKNENNVGNPFKQWMKGIAMAKGEWIWIAESDDFCESNFLDEVVSAAISHKGVVLSYSTSIWVNSDGHPTWTPNNTHENYMSGNRYLTHYLLFACFLYNASSAIFRKNAALKVSDRITTISSAGDYLFWAELSRQGNVVIVNKGLNYFRRHNSASSNKVFLSGENLMNEFEVFSYIVKLTSPSKLRQRMARKYRSAMISKLPSLTDDAKSQLFDVWGRFKISVIDKGILWILLHFRLRYNIYL